MRAILLLLFSLPAAAQVAEPTVGELAGIDAESERGLALYAFVAGAHSAWRATMETVLIAERSENPESARLVLKECLNSWDAQKVFDFGLMMSRVSPNEPLGRFVAQTLTDECDETLSEIGY